jgi:hypothetical protein
MSRLTAYSLVMSFLSLVLSALNLYVLANGPISFCVSGCN